MNFFSSKIVWIPTFTLIVIISIAATSLTQERTTRARRLYDIEKQLTCSNPLEDPTSGLPSTVPVDYFRQTDDVWVSFDPGRMAGEEAWLFVVNADKSIRLGDGDPLEDVSGGVERVFVEKGFGWKGYKIWKAPLVEGVYNVIVDFAPLGVYTRGLDIIDDIGAGSGVGFRVASQNPLIDYIRIDPLEGNNVIDGGCVRIYGTGQSQYWERHYAYGWNNGQNRIPEDGGGDDIRLGQISPAWSTDVPPYLGEIGDNGIFVAAFDYRCGDGNVFADYEIFRAGDGMVILSDTSYIAVLPPDWIPGDSTDVMGR
ncbi:MAG: hypothetical protein ACE5OP_10260 [Candidatus Glassbacteria bacterium]